MAGLRKTGLLGALAVLVAFGGGMTLDLSEGRAASKSVKSFLNGDEGSLQKLQKSKWKKPRNKNNWQNNTATDEDRTVQADKKSRKSVKKKHTNRTQNKRARNEKNTKNLND